MPRPVLRILLLLPTLVASAAGGQALDGHPNRVLSPIPLPAGSHVLEVGFEHRTDAVPHPILGPHRGDLTRVPELRYRIGFGRAELAVGGAAWQSFSPDKAGVDDESGVGDASAWFSVAARKPPDGGLGLAFALGAKWPNASNESGLGTDEADVFLAVMFGQERAAHEWRANVGLAVLGDPHDDSSQEDMLTYGIAGRHGRRHCFTWEIYGRLAGSDGQRDLEEGTLEVGYLLRRARLTAEVSLLVGFEDNSGDVGASGGVAWRFGSDVE